MGHGRVQSPMPKRIVGSRVQRRQILNWCHARGIPWYQGRVSYESDAKRHKLKPSGSDCFFRYVIGLPPRQTWRSVSSMPPHGGLRCDDPGTWM